MPASSAKPAPNPPLAPIKSWVRIRPIGEDGHTDGEPCEKQLGAFDEASVNIVSHDQRGKVTPYSYMGRVFPVDCTQREVGDDVLPGLLQDFWTERNVLIFAYGQTGTGKTHTMFGTPESLSATSEDAGWGLLPRAVHATLRLIDERAAQGVRSVLLLSAVEFYVFQAYDLADRAGKQMCTMKGSRVIGNSYQQCSSPADLAEFLGRVYGNRMTVATAMNAGSSRSHCAITLTLMTNDEGAGAFRETSFCIVDLAGAERPEKASHEGKRVDKQSAWGELFSYWKKLEEGTQPRLSLELQGFLINMELSGLLTEVVHATNKAKAGQAYKDNNSLMESATTKFFGAALSGAARIGVLICLSQSPQNGWETWYSIAQYGAQLANLRTRVRKVPSVSMAKALSQARAEAESAAADLANQRDTPSAMKYAAFRYGMKVYTEQRLVYLQRLVGDGGGEHAPEIS